jgi:hypothetical protein
MSDDTESDVSVAEQHVAVPDSTTLNFASTEDGSKLNTIRLPLAPVACWRLNPPGFAFDSSFVAPAFRKAITKLHDTVDKNPDCPAALFGHCDPAGTDDLNKTLGDRRAIAIYALLTRQTAMWADLYDHPQVGDTWGTQALQLMLRGILDKQGKPYYGEEHVIDGAYGSGTTAAVKSFQPSAGLPANGQADAATRKALFAAYMEWLCTPEVPVGTNPPLAFKMKPNDFLGGGGEGDLPKMSLQGCSEFNPVVLLTTAEMKAGGKGSQRDIDDAPNRRVVMFFFKKGTTVDPAAWPCPKVKEPLAACKKAFWPDGETRRKSGNEQREYKKARDTMACRFYDRFARRSPCETGQKARHIHILLHDGHPQPMRNVRYSHIRQGIRQNAFSTDGWVHLPLPPACERIEILWGAESEDADHPYHMLIATDCSSGSKQEQGIARLDNLGYNASINLIGAVSRFQQDYSVGEDGLTDDGAIPDGTLDALSAIYDGDCDATEPVNEGSTS